MTLAYTQNKKLFFITNERGRKNNVETSMHFGCNLFRLFIYGLVCQKMAER